MSLLRAFIAIELPAPIQDAIQQQTARLRQSLDSSLVRWTPAHNIHLTLKFLGDVSPSNIKLLTDMLTREAEQHSAFDMRIADLGSFPTSRRPRVIWVGLHAPAVLESLQRGIESAAARLGYPSDERPFSPHLTIGRVRQSLSNADLQKIRVALESTQIGELGTTRVACAHLYKSDLQPRTFNQSGMKGAGQPRTFNQSGMKGAGQPRAFDQSGMKGAGQPGGSVYTRLFSAPLRK